MPLVPAARTGLMPGGASTPGPTVTTLTPTLSWNASAGAATYTVAMSQVGGGSVCAMTVTTNSAVCPGLTNGATYLWAVAASNSAGPGPPPAVGVFSGDVGTGVGRAAGWGRGGVSGGGGSLKK